jgi:hypothetical protein
LVVPDATICFGKNALVRAAVGGKPVRSHRRKSPLYGLYTGENPFLVGFVDARLLGSHDDRHHKNYRGDPGTKGDEKNTITSGTGTIENLAGSVACFGTVENALDLIEGCHRCVRRCCMSTMPRSYATLKDKSSETWTNTAGYIRKFASVRFSGSKLNQRISKHQLTGKRALPH